MSLFHLIAPSGYCINQQAALRGVQRLTDAGHQVENDEVIRRRYQRFAGTDSERLADVNSLASLTSPDTIVMPVRGGYGAGRLLDRIDWQALASRQQCDPLLICGHSDFTAIQAGLLAQANVITFSGHYAGGKFWRRNAEYVHRATFLAGATQGAIYRRVARRRPSVRRTRHLMGRKSGDVDFPYRYALDADYR